MGISQQIGASSAIKAGVCTSSTRPASPYEGQVIFETDTDKMLVWNGTVWVIPNSPAQNPMGLELITTGTLSGNPINFAGCFTSTYDNYRIVGDNISTAVAAYPSFRMLVGTTPNTTAAHYSALTGLDSNGNSLNMGINSTVGVIGRQVHGDPGVCGFAYDFYNPKVSSTKTVCSGTFTSFYGTVGSASYSGGVVVDIGTSFDGIQFNTLGGQVYSGGRITIYGYRK